MTCGTHNAWLLMNMLITMMFAVPVVGSSRVKQDGWELSCQARWLGALVSSKMVGSSRVKQDGWELSCQAACKMASSTRQPMTIGVSVSPCQLHRPSVPQYWSCMLQFCEICPNNGRKPCPHSYTTPLHKGPPAC
jgi:hypothetical protein